MKAIGLMLLLGQVYEKFPDAVVTPSLGNLAIRENDADDARFLGIIQFTRGEVMWRDEQ